MIATTVRFRNFVEPTDSTWYDTSASTNFWDSDTSYEITYINDPYPQKVILSLKEWMKLWAIERMIKYRFIPIKRELNKVVKIKPIPLRCVMLNGHGWANQN